jgi:hypothetical protein
MTHNKLLRTTLFYILPYKLIEEFLNPEICDKLL